MGFLKASSPRLPILVFVLRTYVGLVGNAWCGAKTRRALAPRRWKIEAAVGVHTNHYHDAGKHNVLYYKFRVERIQNSYNGGRCIAAVGSACENTIQRYSKRT